MSERPTKLAEQQRSLLALLKKRSVSVGVDPYLDLVRGSRGLPMLRTITTWWRRFDVARFTPLTARALVHAGRLDDAIDRLVSDPSAPASGDGLATYFLAEHADDPDPLIAAVACTEQALKLVRDGDASRHKVPWPCDPVPIFEALLVGTNLGRPSPGRFLVIVSRDLPALMAIEPDRIA